MTDYVLVLCGDPGVPWLGPSGASAHLRGICGGFEANEIDVRLACLRRSDERIQVKQAPQIPCRHLPPPQRWLHQLREATETWWARMMVRQAITKWGPPSLIYERYSLFCDAGLRLQQAYSIPRIVELNAPLSQERPNIRNPRRAQHVEGEVLRGADRVVAVSRWLKQWAIEDIGCAPERVHHVPNGANRPLSITPSSLRASLGNPEILIGYLGSIRPWHGVEHLPDILNALPEAKAVLIGNDATSVSHPRLHSMGFLEADTLSSALSTVDVGIAPYVQQAPPWFCPLKLYDYQAHGLPVVSTDVADCRDILSPKDAVLATNDPITWATAIRRQAGRTPQATQRTWEQVCREAIEGMLPVRGNSSQ